MPKFRQNGHGAGVYINRDGVGVATSSDSSSGVHSAGGVNETRRARESSVLIIIRSVIRIARGHVTGENRRRSLYRVSDN